MLKKYTFLCVVALIFQSRASMAQDSMMPEISYVFLEKLISTAKDNYPRINAHKARVEIAQANISKQQVSWLDAFSFTYMYNPERAVNLLNPFVYNGYQGGVSLNLGNLVQKPSNVKQAKLEKKI